MTALLNIDDLRLSVGSHPGTELLRGVSLSVAKGEVVGLVGESGSGKSLTARAAIGLLPARAVTSGTVHVTGLEALSASTSQLRALRRSKVSMVFQDPRSAINPSRRLGDFLTESLLLDPSWTRARAEERALSLLQEVGLPDPAMHMRQYPHQLSGGMLQRVMIAGALMCEPQLLVCDEPTSALDVLSQAEVVRILRSEQSSRDMGMLFITHDLDLAGAVCDRICVMTGGVIVESGTPREVFSAPAAPYTRTLLAARPSAIATRSFEVSASAEADDTPALRVDGLRKSYHTRQGDVVAVERISFDVRRGQTVALVGESGSGKSTTARMLVGLEEPDDGVVDFPRMSAPVAPGRRNARLARARRAQIVFQDPYHSLDPRLTVRQGIERVLGLHGLAKGAQRTERIDELLSRVGLEERHGAAQPRSLSGGQRQRAAIACSLAVDPEVLVLDEATSALDVSVRAQVLELIDSVRIATGLAVVFVSHDLNLVSSIADHALVMRSGQVVEEGDPRTLLAAPQHPYTRALVEAIPRAAWDLLTLSTPAVEASLAS
ncbi:MAG TPA: ABC transporter ATP-binding protein [Microbacterium sp.]|uniref:ABC transporter ATP-binding protein n=1 Tax=Microbacterium sp. TaxID=51671 RepID=UPI002D1DD47A|nr:ABC transporter ATP-binding protein [Microbacterium sp.]HWI30045.1 ABC transporter ATP-binding protein [Microbacterium sp.]